MKRILLLAAALPALSSFAQSSLTKANNGYAVGDVYNMKATNLSGEGATGNNITWDFSANTQGTTTLVSVVAPSTTAAGASFPAANAAISTNGGTLYYNVDNSGLIYWGVDAGGAAKHVLTDPEEQLRYPMTIGTNYTDSWTGPFTSPGFASMRGGTTTVSCNSYGTLILPQGTFTNVLKVTIVQDYSDTVNGIPMLTYNTNITQWLAPGQHYALASYTTNNASGAYSLMNATLPTSLAKVIDMSELLSIYPNPTSGNLKFSTNTKVKLAKMYMTDLSGKMLQSWDKSQLEQLNAIDISHLPAASYVLHIETIEGYKAGQVIVKK